MSSKPVLSWENPDGSIGFFHLDADGLLVQDKKWRNKPHPDSPEARLARIKKKAHWCLISSIDQEAFAKAFLGMAKGRASKTELHTLLRLIHYVPEDLFVKLVSHQKLNDENIRAILHEVIKNQELDKIIDGFELLYRPHVDKYEFAKTIISHPNVSHGTIVDCLLWIHYWPRELRKLARKRGISKDVLENIETMQEFA